MKPGLCANGNEMYSIQNKEKSVVAEIFIRISKIKIYKYATTL